MPAAYVAQLAKEKGVSVAKAEERWEAAKKSAEDQGRGDDYAYVTGIFKKMMGENEIESLISRVANGEKPEKVWEGALAEYESKWLQYVKGKPTQRGKLKVSIHSFGNKGDSCEVYDSGKKHPNGDPIFVIFNTANGQAMPVSPEDIDKNIS